MPDDGYRYTIPGAEDVIAASGYSVPSITRPSNVLPVPTGEDDWSAKLSNHMTSWIADHSGCTKSGYMKLSKWGMKDSDDGEKVVSGHGRDHMVMPSDTWSTLKPASMDQLVSACAKKVHGQPEVSVYVLEGENMFRKDVRQVEVLPQRSIVPC